MSKHVFLLEFRLPSGPSVWGHVWMPDGLDLHDWILQFSGPQHVTVYSAEVSSSNDLPALIQELNSEMLQKQAASLDTSIDKLTEAMEP